MTSTNLNSTGSWFELLDPVYSNYGEFVLSYPSYVLFIIWFIVAAILIFLTVLLVRAGLRQLLRGISAAVIVISILFILTLLNMSWKYYCSGEFHKIGLRTLRDTDGRVYENIIVRLFTVTEQSFPREDKTTDKFGLVGFCLSKHEFKQQDAVELHFYAANFNYLDFWRTIDSVGTHSFKVYHVPANGRK
jgi:energy-coupling factor transporter transmembrane protein EcfT